MIARLALLAALFALAACGGGSATNPASPSPEGGAAESPAAPTPAAASPLRLQPIAFEGKVLHFKSFVAENGQLCGLTYGGLVFCRGTDGRFAGPIPLSSAADGSSDANPPSVAELIFDGDRLCGLTYGGLIYCEE